MLSRLPLGHNGQRDRYNRPMSLPDPILDILCCPVSHEPLVPLSNQKLKHLNQAIATGEVQFVDHAKVERPLKGALITRDGKVVYAIEDSIPVLLPDRGIGTTQLKDPL